MTKLTLGNTVPFGNWGVGITVAVLLMSMSVEYVVSVLWSVVVEVADTDSPAEVAGAAGAVGAEVAASATGHTVVYKLMISVVTEPSRAGQLVTVGGQDVIV